MDLEFVLRDEYIELYKVLKIEALATTGGEAKAMIAGGEVRVNGKPEMRKRKKLHHGDVVQAAGSRIRIAGREQ